MWVCCVACARWSISTCAARAMALHLTVGDVLQDGRDPRLKKAAGVVETIRRGECSDLIEVMACLGGCGGPVVIDRAAKRERSRPQAPTR